MALSSIAVIVPAGILVDQIPDSYKMLAVMGVLGAASAIGIADILIHGTIPEPIADRRDATVPERGALGTVHFVTDLDLDESFLGGISSTAATTAANKLITRYPPEGRRATYIALSSTVGSVAGGFGVIVAGVLVDIVQTTGLPGLEWTFGGFRLTFLLSFLLRNLATHVLLPRLPE